jgi:hypothetical protein
MSSRLLTRSPRRRGRASSAASRQTGIDEHDPRFANLRSVTRSLTLPAPISATAILAEIAQDLVRGAATIPRNGSATAPGLRGTVEDRIDQMIESKQQLAGDFLSAFLTGAMAILIL